MNFIFRIPAYFNRKFLFSKKNTLSTTSFSKRFNYINKYFFKYPIYTQPQGNLLRLKDDDEQFLYISRPGRIYYYYKGISSRLTHLVNEYRLDSVTFQSGDLIVDVGANIGELSCALQKKYGVRAIVVEPDKVEFLALKKNLDENSTEFYSCPLWNKEEEVEFFPDNESGDSSIIQQREGVNPIKVNAKTLEGILSSSSFWTSGERIRLLKLEAEGAEPEILLGAGAVLSNIDYISVDCGPERGLNQESTMIPVLEILQEKGFKAIDVGFPRGIILFKNISTCRAGVHAERFRSR